MASLPKPNRCPCGSTNLKKFKVPERWVCLDCDRVVAKRSSRILNHNICRGCGAKKGTKPFKHGKNICLDCANDEMTDWKKRQAKHLRAYRQTETVRKQRHANVLRCVQKSPRSWLTYLIASLKRYVNQRRKEKNRDPQTLDIAIDLDFVISLWDAHDGRCAVLGIPMTHTFNDLRTASIDRIDSTKGYTKKNVQLVCQFVNSGKRHRDNADMLALLDESYRLRREREAGLTGVEFAVTR